MDAEAQPGLERVVEEGEVRAVIAVALLHTEGIERTVPAGPDTRLAPRIHQSVPYLACPARFEVQLPAVLAHVRDPLRQGGRASDVDRPRLHEGEGRIRDVVARHAPEDFSGAWSPEPDDRKVLRRFAQLDGRVAIANLQPQPAYVAVDIARAGDDPEVVGAQSRDGDVRGDAAPLLQELRVDDAADWPVDEVAGHTLQQRQRASARDLDLSERAHIDDAGMLAESRMLLRHLVEVGRAGPSKAALIGAGTTPRPVRLVVVNPFPSVLGPEHRAKVLHARVQRACPARAAPLIGVVRIAEKVVVAVRLACELGGIPMVAMYWTETP